MYHSKRFYNTIMQTSIEQNEIITEKSFGVCYNPVKLIFGPSYELYSKNQEIRIEPTQPIILGPSFELLSQHQEIRIEPIPKSSHCLIFDNSFGNVKDDQA